MKGLKAQGNTLTTFKVKSINLVEPLEPTVDTTEPEDASDNEDEDTQSQIILDF